MMRMPARVLQMIVGSLMRAQLKCNECLMSLDCHGRAECDVRDVH